MLNTDQAQVLFRDALRLTGMYLTMKGIITETDWVTYTAPALMIFPTIWGLLSARFSSKLSSVISSATNGDVEKKAAILTAIVDRVPGVQRIVVEPEIAKAAPTPKVVVE